MSELPPPARFGSSPALPVLAPGEIHLWRMALTRDEARIAALRDLLDPEERDRHDRFRYDVHRERFAVRRGALRTVLGRYLGRDPREIRFETGPEGKPELPGRPLRFNLSDSEDLALLGITRGADLGVDLERVREIPDRDDVAGRFFSPAEILEYRSLPAEARLLAFYLTWTRKEAWLKARGVGLSADLASFDVRVEPGPPARLLRVAGDAEEPLRWTLRTEVPAAGWVATVAWRGTDPRFQRFEFLFP
ncbi:MAG: 4'-phosphopantetheinyl transferase superfamily protein [Gemmatimonadetes bacterium]|nr:4'-phosphopantetheinyl transferase superfamily protein [Gemmatimonadota bacterium]